MLLKRIMWLKAWIVYCDSCQSLYLQLPFLSLATQS